MLDFKSIPASQISTSKWTPGLDRKTKLNISQVGFKNRHELASIPVDSLSTLRRDNGDLSVLCHSTGIKELSPVTNQDGVIAERVLAVTKEAHGNKRLTVFGKPNDPSFKNKWLPCAWTVVPFNSFTKIGSFLGNLVDQLHVKAGELLQTPIKQLND